MGSKLIKGWTTGQSVYSYSYPSYQKREEISTLPLA
jgi:hypothetical protein